MMSSFLLMGETSLSLPSIAPGEPLACHVLGVLSVFHLSHQPDLIGVKLGVKSFSAFLICTDLYTRHVARCLPAYALAHAREV